MNTSLTDYRLACSDTAYDIYAFTETWLSSATPSSAIFGQAYSVYRADRSPLTSSKKTGGGVLLAFRSTFKCRLLHPPNCTSVEQLWVALTVLDYTLYVCVIYIPPDKGNDPVVASQHSESLAWITSQMGLRDKILILGDFNMSSVNWITGPACYLYPNLGRSKINNQQRQILDDYSTAGLVQISSVYNSNSRLLDLCFTSSEHIQNTTVVEAPAPLVKYVQHHPPIQVLLRNSVPCKFRSIPDCVRYNYKRTDFLKMNQFLASINWDAILQDLNVDTTVEVVNYVLNYAIEQFTPKTPRQEPRFPPWSTKALKRLKSVKRSALKKYSRNRNPNTKAHYLTCNEQYKRFNDQLFHDYISRTQCNLKQNPKQFWSYVDELRKESGLPSTMMLEGNEASSIKSISSLFRQHFSAVFSNKKLDARQISEAADTVPNRSAIGRHPRITQLTVESACSKMKCSLNPGPDGIPSIVLKNCSLTLSKPLSAIFNRSLSSGYFPSIWKKSYIFPVFKKGDKSDVSNYRGIASLCAMSKLFELLVLDFLKHHCLNYVSETQHGFMPKRSTTTNLVSYTSFIIKTFETRKQVDAIYTDFSAAFDKINHQILLAKLERLGLTDPLLSWIQSYLSGRSMSVKIGSVTSECFAVPSGVPQGSHIGPFLFLLYLNDVNLVLKCFKLSYADDFKLYYVITSRDDAIFLQFELDKFTNWCRINEMSLNANKCSVISFARKHSLITYAYSIDGIPLKRESTIKDLGVLLDSKLSFKEHLGYITSKASKCLGFIFRSAKLFVDIHCMKTLYCSLVRSILEYAVVVWAPYYKSGIQQLERVQHKFIRFALRRLPWSDPHNLPSYEDRCKLIDLDLLEHRRNVCKASFISDVLQSNIDCPNVLQSMNVDSRRRCLRSHLFFRFPVFHTNYGYNEPISSMCRVFNRCYHVFDFHLSRVSNKNQFRKVLV